MHTEVLGVRLSEEVSKKIDVLAEEAGLKRSDWVRALILRELATKEQDWFEFLEENLEVLLKAIPRMSGKSQAQIYKCLSLTQPQIFELSLNERKDLAVNLVESLVKIKSKCS